MGCAPLVRRRQLTQHALRLQHVALLQVVLVRLLLQRRTIRSALVRRAVCTSFISSNFCAVLWRNVLAWHKLLWSTHWVAACHGANRAALQSTAWSHLCDVADLGEELADRRLLQVWKYTPHLHGMCWRS